MYRENGLHLHSKFFFFFLKDSMSCNDILVPLYYYKVYDFENKSRAVRF